MAEITALLADIGLFVLLPWIFWRLTRKVLPIVVLPILLGIVLAAWHVPVKQIGIPSVYGTDIGWVAVLVLAFTAGLEMWQHPGDGPSAHALPQPGLWRLLTGALVALGGPFLVGSILAYTVFLHLPGWAAPQAAPWVSAASIGLCIAVSALPVLIGVVRELDPVHKPMGQLALKLAWWTMQHCGSGWQPFSSQPAGLPRCMAGHHWNFWPSGCLSPWRRLATGPRAISCTRRHGLSG